MIHINRPTSPHLQIYRLPLTGLISISHRITGVLLSLGLVFLVYALLAIAEGEFAYQSLQQTFNLTVVQVAYWGFVYALFFHLCHGVRHLFWDVGVGFENTTLTRYALLELFVALGLTLLSFILVG